MLSGSSEEALRVMLREAALQEAALQHRGVRLQHSLEYLSGPVICCPPDKGSLCQQITGLEITTCVGCH